MSETTEAARVLTEGRSGALAIVLAWLASSDAPPHVQTALKDLRFCDHHAGWKEGCAAAHAGAMETIDVAIAKAKGTT